MKIYTKTGDKGKTALFGGSKVFKNDIRIEAYGTVDELNAYIGLIRDYDIDKETISVLLKIQDRLFTLGAMLATAPNNNRVKTPQIVADDILFLEQEIDKMDEKLPVMKSFILPGGHTVVSFCHIARCVCRRAERRVVELAEKNEVNNDIIRYLNRLSDYLFMLSRKFSNDFNAHEIPWIPIK